MLGISCIPPTISQMTTASRESFSKHSKNNSWETGRVLFDDRKPSYEGAVEGLNHKPYHQFFRQCIKSLESTDVWFDAGCGEGLALKQYINEFKGGATVYGVTLTRPYNSADEENMIDADKKYNRLHLFFHDFLTFPTSSLEGRVRLITDIYGAFDYCGRPFEALKKFAAMLSSGGTLILVFGSMHTVNVTYHGKAIFEKALFAAGSEAFFYLYLATVKGFKILAPEGASPDSIGKVFSFKTDIHERLRKGYFDRVWIMARTNEAFEADPLYTEGEDIQCNDSFASSHRNRKYHWVISDKNKQYVESMEDVTV